MTVPSINEVSGYMTGIVKLVQGDQSGLYFLDLSTRGFWRSFWAFVYCLPAFAYFWVLERNAELQRFPDQLLGTGFFARAAIAEVLSIAAALVAVAIAARPLGIADRFAQWVIAANWLSLPISYVLAAIGLAATSIPGSGGGFLVMIAVIAALIVTWRVYRSALNGDGMLAFIVLLISQAVSVLVAVGLGG
ncbi:MAG: hypothetical protein AAF724_14790 [Pseudomonadota bacterium]